MTQMTKGLERRLLRYGLSAEVAASARQFNVRNRGGRALSISNAVGGDDEWQPVILRTDRLDQVKEWVGNSDDLFVNGTLDADDYISPEIIDGEAFGRDGQPDYALLEKAANAYIFGQSSRVAHFAKHIEQQLGPFRLALYAAADIFIPEGEPLKIEGQELVVVVAERILLEGPMSQIISFAPLKMEAEQLIMQGEQA